MTRLSAGTILGLLAAMICAGCSGNGGDFKTAKQIKQEKEAAGKPVHEEHEHEAAGPHGGAIVELGDEEYHGEVVVDGEHHALTVYLFGPDAKTPAPIAAKEVTVVTEDQKPLTLKAAPQEGDAEGQASKFELVDEAIVEPIVDAGFIHGALQFEVDGKPYRGDIDAHFDGGTHEDHADHKKADHEESEEKKSEDGDKSDKGDGSSPDAPAEPEN